jgi:threonine aldolase
MPPGKTGQGRAGFQARDQHVIFASDNWAGAHPEIAASLSAQAAGFSPAYGKSDLDGVVRDRFSEIFEREVAVFFVSTGTAANALSLTLANRPGGVAFAHRDAHLAINEAGAPEYFADGLKLWPVDGKRGLIEPEALASAIARYPAEFLHTGRPIAVSVTQLTEMGSAYSLAALDAIAAVAKRQNLPLHMDGARFANALAALGCSPAEMTWKRGVDMLSFGGTKNGCWCAEAVVLFDPAQAGEFAFIHKRAAQLFSKSRFVSAQFDAYLRDDLWLATARHANAMAARLAGFMRGSKTMRLAWEPDANMIFAVAEKGIAETLRQAGARFYEEAVPADFAESVGPDEVLCRFVASFATTVEEVDRFGELIG